MFPVGDKFFCDRCNLYDTNGTFRYKLVVEISDMTGRASLLIWNREAVELIGKTSAELRNRSNDVSVLFILMFYIYLFHNIL